MIWEIYDHLSFRLILVYIDQAGFGPVDQKISYELILIGLLTRENFLELFLLSAAFKTSTPKYQTLEEDVIVLFHKKQKRAVKR